MDNTDSNDEVPVEKVDGRKIKRTPWRTITLEDGTTKYDSKPNDPDYFKKYYHEKRKFNDAVKIKCEYCDKCYTKGHKARHEKSNHCIKAQNDKIVLLLS